MYHIKYDQGKALFGFALSGGSRNFGIIRTPVTNADFEALEKTRDTTPAEPRRFE